MLLYFLQLFFILPLAGFAATLLIPAKREKLISHTVLFTVGAQMLLFLVFLGLWWTGGHGILDFKRASLFKTAGYEFFIDIYFDKATAVYFFVGTFLTFLVTNYSRYYLHREKGYKRFFNTILFFFLGYNITIFSGNLETLFIGWEIVGISSFLLIAFYRDRYLPVKNAFKVFSVYRIGDVGLLLAMWASHHLWHENITFLKLHNYELVHGHLQGNSFMGVFISLAILMAAAAKSAQLPFSSWLPKAMEGPTPSSAIFYGSLSVHFGVFLLLRTFPFWEHQVSVRILIGLLGLCTGIVATLIARVQSSAKSQIAYSSMAQIGLIFIEVAAGLESIALIHFAGNAFLRTYQLLVSPSAVSYLIREQFYNYVPRQHTFEDTWPKRLEYAVYVLSLKEWNLDAFMDYMLWKPLRSIGRKLNFLTIKSLLFLTIPLYGAGIVSLYYKENIPEIALAYLPAVFSLTGLVMAIKSFSERKKPVRSWLMILLNYFWILLAVSFFEYLTVREIIFYLGGVVISGILGYVCLVKLQAGEKGEEVDLNRFYGHVYEYPKLAFFFLLACLGITGFPITTTFVGEDIVFSHIEYDQVITATAVSLSFIVSGISAVRMYARIFLGPHVKTYHELPYRSS